MGAPSSPAPVVRPVPWVWPALAIAAAAACVYAPVVHGGWIWDDTLEIVHNPALRDPAWWRPWVAPAGSDYLPLNTTVQWLEWHLWHDRVEGYHLATLALHLANALLLWRLLAKLGLRLAWVAGLIFAVHPVAVESVAWIAEQKNTLSLAFLLGALCAWVDFDAHRRRRDHVLALALFIAALLCKASVVMLPCALLLFAWWKRSRISARDGWDAAPFLAAALVLGLATVYFQRERAIGADLVPLGDLATRFGRAGLIGVFYLGKAVWPATLLPAYPADLFDRSAVVQALPWIGGIVVAVWCWRTRSPWVRGLGFGLGCFALNLVPVLGFVPMAYHRVAWVADHFAYLSLVAVAGLAAAGLEHAIDAAGPRRRGWPIAAGAALVGLTVVSARGYARHFVSEEALWTYALPRNPSAWIGYNNLGKIHAESGRAAEAAEDFAHALQLRPTNADAHYNLANAQLSLGHTAEAITHYQAALRLKPDSPESHNNLGNALAQTGDLAGALAHYAESVRLAPSFPDAHANFARALKRSGRTTEALAQFQTARRLDPGSAAIARDLANLLADTGRADEAVALFRDAVRLQPDEPEAHNNLGALLAERGQIAEAVAEFEAAVRLKPTFEAARENLTMARQQLSELNTKKR